CFVYLSVCAGFGDYLVTDWTYLYRDDVVSVFSGLHPAYALRHQVVEPIGESRPRWQIWNELGEQMGLGLYFPWQDMQTRQL
ncbi:molybdopterin-dependent oxidoreductase, partial [Salmonella enterica subsp. enterica serovar Infantis]